MSIRLPFAAAALALVASGCYATVRAEPVPPPATPAEPAVEADAYEPETYGDAVVYYDAGGLPYYYVSGQVVYVPRTDPRFVVLSDHYRLHRARYQRWYQRDGHRHYERRPQRRR